MPGAVITIASFQVAREYLIGLERDAFEDRNGGMIGARRVGQRFTVFAAAIQNAVRSHRNPTARRILRHR